MRPSIPHEWPTVRHAWIAAFAVHQALLADAIVHDCPDTFYRALSCYPVRRDTSEFWAMWREILEVASDEISPSLRTVVDLFPMGTGA